MGRVLIYRGAEADVSKGEWRGLEAAFKVRKPFAYRHPALDRMVRRQRTGREAEMLKSAKSAGVSAPYVYDVDTGASTLVMEFIEGRRLRELALSSTQGLFKMFEEMGEEVARLHGSGIVHGDLTTANVVRRAGRNVYLDFGLSMHTSKVEDHAVDLRLVKETLRGAHSAISGLAFGRLLAGYSSVAGESRAKRVASQLRNIERRGRYARVV
ncbi:MAG: Kae1-associated serine/threonine protein kinase [Thaumarchaeota archaeon]|nr:Kae1-associated serine/threonine protein kinase [Nitrososphaerota archaeon]